MKEIINLLLSENHEDNILGLRMAKIQDENFICNICEYLQIDVKYQPSLDVRKSDRYTIWMNYFHAYQDHDIYFCKKYKTALDSNWEKILNQYD